MLKIAVILCVTFLLVGLCSKYTCFIILLFRQNGFDSPILLSGGKGAMAAVYLCTGTIRGVSGFRHSLLVGGLWCMEQ